jgi:hypothetical protein
MSKLTPETLRELSRHARALPQSINLDPDIVEAHADAWEAERDEARRWSAAWKAASKRRKEQAQYYIRIWMLLMTTSTNLLRERDEARRWVRRLWAKNEELVYDAEKAVMDAAELKTERDALMPILETIHRCINEPDDYFIREVVKVSVVADETRRKLEQSHE